jgi:hypothetical protein
MNLEENSQHKKMKEMACEKGKERVEGGWVCKTFSFAGQMP